MIDLWDCFLLWPAVNSPLKLSQRISCKSAGGPLLSALNRVSFHPRLLISYDKTKAQPSSSSFVSFFRLLSKRLVSCIKYLHKFYRALLTFGRSPKHSSFFLMRKKFLSAFKIQKPWSRKITPSNQSTSIICQLRWKSQTVCWICITSPQRGRWTKRTGGLLSIRPPPHQHVKCLRSMAEGIYSHNKDRCHLLSA